MDNIELDHICDEVLLHHLIPLLGLNTTMNNVNKKWRNLCTKTNNLHLNDFVNSIENIKWARENGCPWNEYICAKIASQGNLDVLKWVRENGCLWDKSVFSRAAENGHLHILKWARENGCPLDESLFSRAVKYGHLHILKWAKKNNLDNRMLDIWTSADAVRYGHLHILKWARENNYPWNDKCLYKCAITYKRLDIFNWLRENGCPWDYSIYIKAKKNGEDNIINWLEENKLITPNSYPLLNNCYS